MKRDTKQTIAVFTLLVLIWAMFCVSYFSHTHRDTYGRLVVHSHPFQTSSKSQSPHHSHTQQEFEYLSAVYEAFFAFILLLVIFFVFLKENSKSGFFKPIAILQHLLPIHSSRAPPQLYCS